jgi:putative DNA primase/helicase
MLGRALGVAARWVKINGKGKTVRIDPPSEVVAQIAGMAGEWPFPPLTGVIGTPTLRPDGSLLMREGYDSTTGLILTDLPQMPAIPDRPTRAAAETALKLLKELLTEFPFANEESRSVALSMLLTPVLRGALPPAVPLHVVTAPEAGTGKSYLADIASTIASGERCAVPALAPDQGETEKRLIGAALAGHSTIALDNRSRLLIGDFLCQVTERPLLQLRALGSSAMVRVWNIFTVFANGNNITVGADVVRRTLQCALDANMENPEERHFKADPLGMVLADRGRYVAACLTIARAYIVAGRPGRQPSLPSFEAWSDVVRSALVWLGSADPVKTSSALRAEDPLRQTRAQVFHAWASELGFSDSGFLSSQIADAAQQRDPFGVSVHPTLREVLLTVAGARDKGEARIDARRLGLWLHKATNSIAAGHKLTVDRQDATRPRWILRPVKRCGDAGVAGVASALSREKFGSG